MQCFATRGRLDWRPPLARFRLPMIPAPDFHSQCPVFEYARRLAGGSIAENCEPRDRVEERESTDDLVQRHLGYPRRDKMNL